MSVSWTLTTPAPWDAGQVAWENPELPAWRRVMHEETQYDYYYHPDSGQSSWHLPEEYSWKQTLSTDHERHYWFNSKTKEVSWDPPPHAAWRPQLLNPDLPNSHLGI
jgi:hypothetical protein